MRVSGAAWSSWIGFFLVICVYAASFFLPVLAIPLPDQPAMDRLKAEVAGRAGGGEVIRVEGPSEFVVKGYQSFRSGPRPSGGWVLAVAWCANPVLWVGCLLLLARWWRGAALAGVVALGLGAAMAVSATVTFGDPRADIRWSVADYRVGYWLWLASMALMAAAGVVGLRVRRRPCPSAATPNNPLQQTGGALFEIWRSPSPAGC
jgi:hypothetical protein